MQKEKLVLSSREKHENDPDSIYTKKSVEMGCKRVLERSVSDSIRKSVSNGMLYVEDERYALRFAQTTPLESVK